MWFCCSILKYNFKCQKSFLSLIGIWFWDLHAFFFSLHFFIFLFLCTKIPAFYVVFFSSLIYAMAETSVSLHQTLLFGRRTLTTVPKIFFPKNSSYKIIFKTSD